MNRAVAVRKPLLPWSEHSSQCWEHRTMSCKWDLRETAALPWQEAPVPHGPHLHRVHKGLLSGDPSRAGMDGVCISPHDTQLLFWL